MLVKRKGSAQPRIDGLASAMVDRRSFLRNSGLVASGIAAISTAPTMLRKAKAAGTSATGPDIVLKKNICTHCSVGCTVTAETIKGVWVGQEPSWDSPINRGTHCAKGASIRELVHGDRRLRYPMKMANGQWQRISWDQGVIHACHLMRGRFYETGLAHRNFLPLFVIRFRAIIAR